MRTLLSFLLGTQWLCISHQTPLRVQITLNNLSLTSPAALMSKSELSIFYSLMVCLFKGTQVPKSAFPPHLCPYRFTFTLKRGGEGVKRKEVRKLLTQPG